MSGPSAPLSAGRVYRPEDPADPAEQRKKAAWRAFLVLRKMASVKGVADQMSQRAAQAMMKSWGVPAKGTPNPHALSLEAALGDTSQKTTLFLDALVASHRPGVSPAACSASPLLPSWVNTPSPVSAILPYSLAVRLSPIPVVCDRELQENFSRLGVGKMTRISGLEICLHSRSLPIIANLLNLHGAFSGLQVRLDTPMRWDERQQTAMQGMALQPQEVPVQSSPLPAQHDSLRTSLDASPREPESEAADAGADPEATMQRLMTDGGDVDTRAMSLLHQLLGKSEAQDALHKDRAHGRAVHRPKFKP